MASGIKKLRCLREDEKSSIKRAFEFLDTDKDGHLDYYETKAAVRALGFEIKKPQLLAIMQAHDSRNANKINFQDFYYVMADKIAKRNPLDEIRHAYKLFTARSACGKITIADLRRIGESLACRLSDEETEAMIEEFDINEDGCIDESEFIEIMKNSL